MTSNAARPLVDRRRQPTPVFSRYWLRGQRRGGGERELRSVYVDRYSGYELALVVSLVMLSMTDLLLTLIHIEAGGGEANPLLASVLTHGGATAFAAAKLTLTVPPALALLVHVRFRGVRLALELLVVAYLAVMIWHAVVAYARMV